MKDWITCSHCGEEFKIITQFADYLFCPCCGSELEDLDEDFDDDENEDNWDFDPE